MRCIDADALGIGKADRNSFTVPEYADGWNSAIDIIANAPTADVVEVVRCKDCRYKLQCNQYVLMTGDEICLGFCSYGERSEHEKQAD